MIDKAEVARRQLGLALDLFIHDRDPVSVHTLACAGMEISEHLAVKSGAKPFRLFREKSLPAITTRDYHGIRTTFGNAFKHADTRQGRERDDALLLETFSDLENDERLFIGWFDFGCSGPAASGRTSCIPSVVPALHPEKMSNSEAWAFRDELAGLFPLLLNAPRDRQKIRLRREIEKARRSRAFMSGDKIDPRPLVLGRL